MLKFHAYASFVSRTKIYHVNVPKTISDWRDGTGTFRNVTLFASGLCRTNTNYTLSCGTFIFILDMYLVQCRHLQQLKMMKVYMAQKEALQSPLQNFMVCFIPSLKQISDIVNRKTLSTILHWKMWPFQAC